MGHLQTPMIPRNRPFERLVWGGIADLAIHRKQQFTSGKYWELPWELERKVLAYSVEKRGFASGAKTHEEFCSILRAIASNGQRL